jgi:hypothetical protein
MMAEVMLPLDALVALGRMEEKLTNHERILGEIREQVILTNHRVTVLEQLKALLLGVGAVLLVLLGAVVKVVLGG